ncbi:hypothetical protein AB0O70_04715 [Microbacterium paraoxydans]|uniref:hypothetical protein n=1 Tax=Microbacterium TaxID=33882 RepID=UPI000D0159D3|nr:hypothetical protein [Microbacterium sp. str. 'China']AVL96692.1 hypothetical protein C6C15_06025 [Microbacterium sp. str. 'China']
MTADPRQGRALLLSYSDIETDPRVRRQVDWLISDGWEVETLGLGGHPSPQVVEHHVLGPAPRWTTTRWGTLVAQFLLTAPARFRATVTSRIPEELRARVRSGRYGLIVFNEYEFTPWVDDRRDFTPEALAGSLHLDLHEYRRTDRRRDTIGGRLTAGHYRWVRRHIGDAAFTSRTVVCAPIGELYAEEFGFPAPAVVQNAPPFVAQEPSPVDEGEIRMLFHGMPSMHRGFTEILDAMRTLPPRFSMTFMIMPNAFMHGWLRDQIAAHPARDRLHIVPPAPMREIAERVNEYDMEIIFYRPREKNLEFALPNKFFESIQGRLAIVVADGRTMAPIVREWQNGVVVTSGYEGDDLASALQGLTAADVEQMKRGSHAAAERLNAAAEGRSFLGAL